MPACCSVDERGLRIPESDGSSQLSYSSLVALSYKIPRPAYRCQIRDFFKSITALPNSTENILCTFIVWTHPRHFPDQFDNRRSSSISNKEGFLKLLERKCVIWAEPTVKSTARVNYPIIFSSVHVVPMLSTADTKSSAGACPSALPAMSDSSLHIRPANTPRPQMDTH